MVDIPILGTADLGAQIQERLKKDKNEKLLPATRFSKFSNESEHINAVTRTKKTSQYSILLCFPKYLDKKVGTSCLELSKKQVDQLEHTSRVSRFCVLALGSKSLRDYKVDFLHSPEVN